MVEGHSVHRVATLHRLRLVGRSFHATSPNGRFEDGAAAIHLKTFRRIEAVGKNLFCFFGSAKSSSVSASGKPTSNKKKCDDDNWNYDDDVVVHVHFGMAGNWACYNLLEGENPPEPPSSTCRLRLRDTEGQYVADLSAMTVQYGTVQDLYLKKRSNLGEDPLRDDADPERLWERVSSSKKSIGALIMDQSYFTGPGNIYRAEICFKASIHPDRPGNSLSKTEFERIWFHTVDLLKRGYLTGSILTVDADEARALGCPKLRRYIYNTSKCPRCSTSIQTWQIASRTCYACPKCQPRNGDSESVTNVKVESVVSTADVPGTPSESTARRVVTPQKSRSTKSKKTTKSTATTTATKDCVPFNSHCARESVTVRLKQFGPSLLTVKEIRLQLEELGLVDVPSNLKKAQLVKLLDDALTNNVDKVNSDVNFKPIRSSEDAAAEKALAGESLAVEHVAELAPGQARAARSRAQADGRRVRNEINNNDATRDAKRRKQR